MERICQFCQNIPGCQYLGDAHGRFSESSVVTNNSMRDCPGFEEVGTREKEGVRQRLYALSGLGYLRALYELPETVMLDLRQGEKDELMYEDIPKFESPPLLEKYMRVSAREEVLRYETDDKGKVIVDVDSTGHQAKRARPTFHLKHYATDPEGPINLSKSVAWFWTTNQLVEHILAKELEDGVLSKDVKQQVTAKTVPVTTPAVQAKETSMATVGKPVRVLNRAPAPTAVTAGPPRKVTPKAAEPAAAEEPVKRGPGRPPKAAAPAGAPVAGPRKIIPGAPARGPGRPPSALKVAPPAAPEADEGAAETTPDTRAAGLDLEHLASVVKAAVAEQLEPLTATLNTLVGMIDTARKQSRDDITVLHDILVQAGVLKYQQVDDEGNGLFDDNGNPVTQPFPQLGENDDRISAYVTGTAFGEAAAEDTSAGE